MMFLYSKLFTLLCVTGIIQCKNTEASLRRTTASVGSTFEKESIPLPHVHEAKSSTPTSPKGLIGRGKRTSHPLSHSSLHNKSTRAIPPGTPISTKAKLEVSPIQKNSLRRIKRAGIPYKKMPRGPHRLAYAWANPTITPSTPPPLTGKQMGVINTPSIPPLGYEMDGNVKVFRLHAQPVEQYIIDGKEADYERLIPNKNKVPADIMHRHNSIQKVRAWGFNGTSPGPTIEATEGDRIRLVITNELPEPLSVHSHGIELPNDQDGMGGYSEPVIMPGETRKYEYTLYQSGTAFYHGEFNLMKATSYGLTGALIIHPKKYERLPDKQFVITLQEWRILPGNVDPDLVSMDFNWFTFNGRSAPSIPMMAVAQGDRVRIRIINMSMNNHPIHMHGHTWWVVGTEGGPIPRSAQWPGNTVDVPPGGSRDVEFIAWNPGLWFFHCHKVHHVMNAHTDVPLGIMGHGGMFTIVRVIPHDPKTPWRHPKTEGRNVSSRDYCKPQEEKR